MNEISAIINFHSEGLLAVASIRSYFRCCDRASDNGYSIQKIAVLDRPDELTQSIIEEFLTNFDRFEIVEHGDLGESRNTGRKLSTGQYIAFFDGDDLWGDRWLYSAMDLAKLESASSVICHPEAVYYFDSSDYQCNLAGLIPSPSARSFYLIHKDSQDVDFRRWKIRYNNIWTSNIVCSQDVFDHVPYRPVDVASGFGVEDWTWNAETLYAGIHHAVVPDTVHLVRVKSAGSLGALNGERKLLPELRNLGPVTITS